MTDLVKAYDLLIKAVKDGSVQASNLSVDYMKTNEDNLGKISVDRTINAPCLDGIPNITFTASVEYYTKENDGRVVSICNDGDDFIGYSEPDLEIYPYSLACKVMLATGDCVTVMADLFHPDLRDCIKPYIESVLPYHGTHNQLKMLYVG